MIKKVIAKQDVGQPIREYVQTEIQLSQRALKKLKNTPGGIQVNGVERTVRYILQAGDVLTLHFPPEGSGSTLQAQEMPLQIVYEDDAIMIIEKPSGIPTIPSRTHPSGTIANGLLYYYEKKELPYTVHIVTRLDRDTSGLLLIAKHRHAHHLLSKQLQAGEIKRLYEAIVHGSIELDKGTIDAPIGRKNDSIIEREVRSDGQCAITHYEVVERSEHSTYVRVLLGTGRTHQIRVHFAHLGHPLLGDGLYGGSVSVLRRQALHACSLSFRHPLTNEMMQFQAKLPAELENILINDCSLD